MTVRRLSYIEIIDKINKKIYPRKISLSYYNEIYFHNQSMKAPDERLCLFNCEDCGSNKIAKYTFLKQGKSLLCTNCSIIRATSTTRYDYDELIDEIDIIFANNNHKLELIIDNKQ